MGHGGAGRVVAAGFLRGVFPAPPRLRERRRSSAGERVLGRSAPQERARRLRAQLGSPTGTFVRRIAPEDPWLLFLDHVERLREALQGDLAVHEGGFVSGCDDEAPEAGCYGVVLATSAFSPFEVARSRVLDAAIDEAFADVRGDAPWTLERAGVHRSRCAAKPRFAATSSESRWRARSASWS
ncbi:MAG: hypothetical protein R3B99_01980 [Polyangiales bacterium]